jgi:CRISPR system Cascade subunit CasC
VGSAHIGITEFAAGLFYLYVCIDRQLLLKNLDGDHELAAKTLHYLIEAIATIAPTGKQNSFASRARASFIVAEKGNQQPRSLSVAYLKPIQDKHDVLTKAIQALTTAREKMNLVYGDCANETYTVNAETAEGTLKMLQQFVSN